MLKWHTRVRLRYVKQTMALLGSEGPNSGVSILWISELGSASFLKNSTMMDNTRKAMNKTLYRGKDTD